MHDAIPLSLPQEGHYIVYILPVVPDDLVLLVVTRRLSCAECTAQGWVLHGFPLTGNQTELLAQAGHEPNR